jgi:hypothetical protein
MIRKMTQTIKVKIPNGIAKHGFLNLPVAHPRRAIRIPTTPIAMFPLPIPAPASISGMLNDFAYSSLIGICPPYIAPKITITSPIIPIRTETPMTITEHLCLYLSV